MPGASGADVLHDVVWRHRGKKIAPKTLNQKRYVDAIRRATVTFGIGPAGTGKTYLAMALAVSALVDREVSRIILTRPAVEAGEHLGFLPGDMQAKVDPYLRPLFDAVYDMLDADRLQTSMEKGLIEVAPLAFMRGRTLNDSFIILDEAQNTTPEQMQMFLTRLGFNSKIVVTGDVTQTDLKGGQRSGLVDVDELLRGIPDIEFVASAARTSCGTSSWRASSRHTTHVPRRASAARPGRQRGSELSDVPVDLVLQGVAEAGLDPASVERLVQGVLDDSASRGRARSSVCLVEDDEIRGLNRDHRGLDEVTDVLSFPVDGLDPLPPGMERELGDVVISLAQARRQAGDEGVASWRS